MSLWTQHVFFSCLTCAYAYASLDKLVTQLQGLCPSGCCSPNFMPWRLSEEKASALAGLKLLQPAEALASLAFATSALRKGTRISLQLQRPKKQAPRCSILRSILQSSSHTSAYEALTCRGRAERKTGHIPGAGDTAGTCNPKKMACSSQCQARKACQGH